MKYLKKFNTESDYQVFKNGDDWITPNVSVIEETSGCKYNGINKIVNFIINNSEGMYTNFQAPGQMTWEEWLNSEYNTDGYVKSCGTHVVSSWNNYHVCSDSTPVKLSDYITNTTYTCTWIANHGGSN